MKVDGVLVRDNVGDGRALGLAGLLLGGHFLRGILLEKSCLRARIGYISTYDGGRRVVDRFVQVKVSKEKLPNGNVRTAKILAS